MKAKAARNTTKGKRVVKKPITRNKNSSQSVRLRIGITFQLKWWSFSPNSLSIFGFLFDSNVYVVLFSASSFFGSFSRKRARSAGYHISCLQKIKENKVNHRTKLTVHEKSFNLLDLLEKIFIKGFFNIPSSPWQILFDSITCLIKWFFPSTLPRILVYVGI